MKKIIRLGLLALSVGILGACNNKENETKISEQQKTIESLEGKVKDLEKEQASIANSKDGEPFVLSGKVIVGTDIEVGGYDIKPTDFGNKSEESEPGGTFNLYENAEDEKNGKYEFYYVKDEASSLKSFSLRKGNILEITKNLEFTKVR